MADLINLRKTRKTKAKAEKSARADENRVRYGQTKMEKQALDKENMANIRKLDNKRLN